MESTQATTRFKLAVLVGLALPALCHAEPGDEPYAEIGEAGAVEDERGNEQRAQISEVCVMATEPKSCMESYGFGCHQGRLPDRSVEAQSLGCNLDLGDGRMHFVQMLYDNGGWNVEVQRTYWPDYAETKAPEEDPALALSAYVSNAMKNYSTHSSGAGSDDAGRLLEFVSGTLRNDGPITVRAMCGVIFVDGLDESASTSIQSECEYLLMRTVRKVSQPQDRGPYRVPGSSQFEWQQRITRLVSGDTAFIVDGRYRFTEKHVPCLWISDCCSHEGQFYLDSCRTPSDSDLKTIQTCLSKEGTHHTEAFTHCLRSAGMKAGCEDQADGSKICY